MQKTRLDAILIDDEEHNLLNMEALLLDYCPEVKVVAKARNAMEGYQLIQKVQPDLIFLDVEMPGGTGFDLLERLTPLDAAVIFVTAYDKYAIKAFRFSAVDYLLKPVNILDLQAAVEKVLARKKGYNADLLFKNLLEQYRAPGATDRKIALPTADQLLFIAVKQILRCEGESNYTHFYLVDAGHILVTRTLKEYDDLLQEYGFMRTHQSHLVNLDYVKKYVKSDGGFLIMRDDSRVDISRAKKEKVLEALMAR